jgi:hypothetical protein
MKEDMVVITKLYDLVTYSIPLIHKFPKLFRFSLGSRIENGLYEILLDLVRAKYSHTKKATLMEVNLRIEQMRFLIRLSKDFRVLSIRAYEQIVKRLNEVGSLVGGWIKKAKR